MPCVAFRAAFVDPVLRLFRHKLATKCLMSSASARQGSCGRGRLRARASTTLQPRPNPTHARRRPQGAGCAQSRPLRPCLKVASKRTSRRAAARSPEPPVKISVAAPLTAAETCGGGGGSGGREALSGCDKGGRTSHRGCSRPSPSPWPPDPPGRANAQLQVRRLLRRGRRRQTTE